MQTFLDIALYSVFMLVGLTVASAALVFLGVWLTDQSDEIYESDGH